MPDTTPTVQPDIAPTPAAVAPLEGAHVRFIRQSDFIPTEKILATPVAIIGCGAIGRQVAIQLVSMGSRKITLIDFDSVTPTNVTTQGFLAADVFVEKVYAVEKFLKAIDPEVEVTCIYDRYRSKMKIPEVVFLCVDSIKDRKLIWESLKDKTKLLIDGRMLGETMRILATNDITTRYVYEKSFFAPEETVEGRCTAHATISTSNIAGGLMTHQYRRHLAGFPLDPDMSMNLLAGELTPVLV